MGASPFLFHRGLTLNGPLQLRGYTAAVCIQFSVVLDPFVGGTASFHRDIHKIVVVEVKLIGYPALVRFELRFRQPLMIGP